MAYLFSRIFKPLHNECTLSCVCESLTCRIDSFLDQAQKRKLLAAAASAGVSVAFGSPLGGVLFGLEELDTFSFSNEGDVMWRGFVTSVIAAVSLQWVDPFGTSTLVLFQVTGVSDTWRAFELVGIIPNFASMPGSPARLDPMASVGRHWG